MKDYTLLYRDRTLLPADAPIAFTCVAHDCEHAEEQLKNAVQDSECVWIENGHNIDYTYQSYYGENEAQP